MDATHNSSFPNLNDLATKIKVDKPIAELDGDEMTRIIWHKIRDEVRVQLDIHKRLLPPNPVSIRDLSFRFPCSHILWSLTNSF